MNQKKTLYCSLKLHLHNKYCFSEDLKSIFSIFTITIISLSVLTITMRFKYCDYEDNDLKNVVNVHEVPAETSVCL